MMMAVIIRSIINIKLRKNPVKLVLLSYHYVFREETSAEGKI